jgi:hypothetical protein
VKSHAVSKGAMAFEKTGDAEQLSKLWASQNFVQRGVKSLLVIEDDKVAQRASSSDR